MKLKHLQIDGYKNIRGCDVEFNDGHFLNAIIGGNGSGKSNLIEAILEILIGFYFERPPRFNFRMVFEAQNRLIVLHREGRKSGVTVDGNHMPMDHFAKRLRDGPAQVYFPELTLVYYSGECPRVAMLVDRYRRQFERLTRKPETDRFRPLFVKSSNEQSKVILLALFAHGGRELLDYLGLDSISQVSIVLRSPHGFDSKLHEPKLWNTEGSIRRIIASIDETASFQETRRIPRPYVPSTESSSVISGYREERRYVFEEQSRTGLRELARRLTAEGDNLYLALEGLRARRIFKSVSFQLRGKAAAEPFAFEQLSEGEKQLLAVIGAITLANQQDNLVLLDEPDTHLNPHWTWDYPSMLEGALQAHQQDSSTVLMTTHDPVMISGMLRDQVLLANLPKPEQPLFSRPRRNPRGQGVANLLSSSEFFGLPSSLDKETQKLLERRYEIIVKPELTEHDKALLRSLNSRLEILPGVSERDPKFAEYLRQKAQEND